MTTQHVGDLQLRRLFAGELPGVETRRIQDHAEACPRCKGALRTIEEEQRRFELDIPFDRFEQGVLRSVRTHKPVHRPKWLPALMATAAALVIAAGLHPLWMGSERISSRNRLKGGAEVFLRIASITGGAQRTADTHAPETLLPGERVRIGYHAGPFHFVTAVSVDQTGEVTALYPESGLSVPVTEASGPLYLPGSLEFTGSGAERVVVVLSDRALDVESVRQAAVEAYKKADGDLERLPALNVAGNQFHQLLLKP